MRVGNLPLLTALAALGSPPASAQVFFEDTILHQMPVSADYGDRISTGDVNGDGHVDVALVDPGWMLQGRGWVLLGPDFQTALDVAIPDLAPYDLIGGNLGAWSLCDVTGDGLDDLLMSGSWSYAGTALKGVGRALIGLAPTFQTVIELQHPDPTQAMAFGRSMVAHDFTGDGVVDVAVGSPSAPGPLGEVGVGRIDVYSGTALHGAAVLTLVPPPPHFLQHWGNVLLVADYDLDGVPDLLTSDRVFGYGFSWLLGIDSSALVSWDYWGSGLGVPYGNTRLADLDGDGGLDLVAAEENIQKAVGISYGPAHVDELLLKAPLTDDVHPGFGRGLDVGDVNRDGVPDVVIGVPGLTVDGQTSIGRVTIYYGPTYALKQDLPGAHPYASFGQGVHLLDLDGDGFDEMLVGAGAEYGGRLHLFHHPTLRILGRDEVSVSAGGDVRFSIGVGAKSGSSAYVLLLGGSGSAPGVDLPFAGGFVHVPLNPDGLTKAGLALVGSPMLETFLGVTSAAGDATATLHLPPGLLGPAFAGSTITAAAVLAGASGVDYATEDAELLLTP